MSAMGTFLRPVFDVEPRDLPDLTNAGTQPAERLRQVVYTVTECCEVALRTPNQDRLYRRLEEYPDELKGFAFEGAGVGLAALDTMTGRPLRTTRFVSGPAAPYVYAIYLGTGMGLARLHRNPERFRRRLSDDVFSWVILDGYGFHEGFFSFKRHVQEQSTPPWLSGYAAQPFDHGLGRAIWFATGADPNRIADTIAAFPGWRQPSLWAGIGLACGYTGGVDAQPLRQVAEASQEHRDRLAEGVMVAAMNRHMVGNTAAHNDLASELICGMPSDEAARMTRDALDDLPTDAVVPAYAVWRRRLTPGSHLTRERVSG